MRSVDPPSLLLAATLAFGLAVCGGDGGGPEEPEIPNIAGTWTYSAADLAGGPVTCRITGVSATLTQTGSSFSGTTQGGTIACQSGASSGAQPLNAYLITDGSISGNSVTFTLVSGSQAEVVDMNHAGSVSGSSMSGTVTAQLEMPPPYGFVVTLSGTWTASRQ